MTFAQALAFLSTLTREELHDHAFGDREIYWKDANGTMVADGYSGASPEVNIYPVGTKEGEEIVFHGQTARELFTAGITGEIRRNDSTGPSDFREGECLPKLTLAGVREELTGKKDS